MMQKYTITKQISKHGKQAEPEASVSVQPVIVNSSIEELVEGYRITGIKYCNEIAAYDFAKDTLPRKTQDKHAEHAMNARQDEFVAASAPLVYAICKTLYINKDCVQKEIVEKARKSLEGIIGQGKPWINTLSRAIYKTKGKGKVIHDYKQKTQYVIRATLVGPNGDIVDKNTNAEAYCQAVLDTTDTVKEINEVFKWITCKKAYAWRLNETPATKQGWVVALGVVSNVRFFLNADGFISNDRPALGVRCAK